MYIHSMSEQTQAQQELNKQRAERGCKEGHKMAFETDGRAFWLVQFCECGKSRKKNFRAGLSTPWK